MSRHCAGRRAGIGASTGRITAQVYRQAVSVVSDTLEQLPEHGANATAWRRLGREGEQTLTAALDNPEGGAPFRDQEARAGAEEEQRRAPERGVQGHVCKRSEHKFTDSTSAGRRPPCTAGHPRRGSSAHPLPLRFRALPSATLNAGKGYHFGSCAACYAADRSCRASPSAAAGRMPPHHRVIIQPPTDIRRRGVSDRIRTDGSPSRPRKLSPSPPGSVTGSAYAFWPPKSEGTGSPNHGQIIRDFDRRGYLSDR
jgi:hypothetical protein